jgi:hypothetical protein
MILLILILIIIMIGGTNCSKQKSDDNQILVIPSYYVEYEGKRVTVPGQTYEYRPFLGWVSIDINY